MLKGNVSAVVISNFSNFVKGSDNSEDLKSVENKRFEKEVIHRDNFVKAVDGWVYHKNKK